MYRTLWIAASKLASCAWLPTFIFTAIVVPAFTMAGEPYGRHQFDESERDHWAFLPVKAPEVPQVSHAEWVRTPIDSFILAQLESEGIEPAKPTDRRTLLRRAYFDLIGLPPTPSEQQAFLDDTSPDAYAKLIDQLLARPEYGERWGRYWLDVVRFAESNGYERDGAKPQAWRYRDYVIAAFNDDKPYDRFLIEQLAGDEIEGSNADTQIATTFLRLGPWDDEPADPLIDRYDQLDDVLGTTAATFMALTLRCARCHDHKYEPFAQQDYARMLAIFEPLKRPQNGRTDLDRLVGTQAELASYEQTVTRVDTHVAELGKQCESLKEVVRRRLFDEKKTSLPADAVAAFQAVAEKRNESQKKLVEEFSGKLSEEVAAQSTELEREQLRLLDEQIAKAKADRPAEPPRGYIWYEEGTQASATHVFYRGDPRSPRDEIAPGFPAVLVDAPPTAPSPTANSTGRRRQLAEWLARADHPLTARVMVNRIWQHHFGDGLVATENDFGVMGDAPSNEALLDYLAAQFVAGGWRMKPLHRMLMLSSAYQQTAAVNNPQAERSDPEVRTLWRWRPRRLEAEAVRDSILAVSGQLNPARGGPSAFPKISPAVMASQSRPGDGWKQSDPREAARRSVYVFVKRTLPVPELEVLDFPNTNASCEQRTVSTVAPQALTYLNGEFIQEQAHHFAERLRTECGPDLDRQIAQAFLLAFCRPVGEDERIAAREFLAAQTAQIEADRQTLAQQTPDAAAPTTPSDVKALEAFCLVMLSANEFVYLH